MDLTIQTFCEKYVQKFTLFLNLLDQELLEIQESARFSAIADVYQKEMTQTEKTKLINEINSRCDNLLFEMLQELKLTNLDAYSYINDYLTKLLIKYKYYATCLKMQTPEEAVALTMRDFYYDYLKALNYLKTQELINQK